MGDLMVGDTVTIRYSKELERNENCLLVNRLGTVTRIVRDKGVTVGAYVDVKVMRKVRNYYIPICSIEGPDQINKIRNLGMLKSIKL